MTHILTHEKNNSNKIIKIRSFNISDINFKILVYDEVTFYKIFRGFQKYLTNVENVKISSREFISRNFMYMVCEKKPPPLVCGKCFVVLQNAYVKTIKEEPLLVKILGPFRLIRN